MLFNAFSNPLGGDFITLSAKMSKRCFEQVVKITNAEAKNMGLPTLVFDLPLEDSLVYWRPEIGVAILSTNESYKKDSAYFQWLIVQVKVAAFLCGIDREISICLSNQSYPVTIAGYKFYGQKLVVESEGKQLRIQLDGKVTVFDMLDDDYANPVWLQPQKQANLIKMGSCGAASLSITDWLEDWSPDTPLNNLTVDYQGFKEQLEKAYCFLEEHLKEYYIWCTAMIREFVPLNREHARSTSSRSFMLWPGQIHLSCPATLIQTLTMLIHECSHQYFHLLQWSFVVTKSGSPMGFSVLKSIHRPLDKILLGYHAFANVLIVLDIIDELGLDAVDKQELKEQKIHVAKYVANLEQQLEEALSWLTDEGLEIYNPLRQILTERALLNNVQI